MSCTNGRCYFCVLQGVSRQKTGGVSMFFVMLLRPGVRRPRRKNGRRKYRWVSAEGWAMVKKLFPRAADQEYPAGTEPCSQCEEQVGTTIYEIYYGVGASAVPLSGVL